MKPLSFLFILISLNAVSQPALLEFRNSMCNSEEDPSRLRTRIISRKLEHNILTIEIAATATCCVSFKPVTAVREGILYLDFEETGEPCECSCCYEFVYRVFGISQSDIPVRFRKEQIEQSGEKYKTYPVVFEWYKGDTINRRDKYGFRQGIWRNLPKDSMDYRAYADDHLIRLVRFYPDKKLKSEMIAEKIKFEWEGRSYDTYPGLNELIEYFPSGQKKKECYSDKKGWNNDHNKGLCREWNEKGELIYEGVFRD